jgi:hypothetical protein
MNKSNAIWGSFFATFSFFEKSNWFIEDSTKVFYSLFLIPEWHVNIKSFFEMIPFKKKQIDDMNQWRDLHNNSFNKENIILRLQTSINPPKEWSLLFKNNPKLESLYSTICEGNPLQTSYFEKNWTTKQFCAFYLTLYHGEWDSTEYKVAIKAYPNIQKFISANSQMDITQAVNIINYIGL